MLTPDEEKGIYECISKLPEIWYSDIYVGMWYGVTFEINDIAEIKDATRNRWYFIPKQDFLDHFKKIVTKLEKTKVGE